MSSRWIRAALWTVAIVAPGGLVLVPILVAASRKPTSSVPALPTTSAPPDTTT